MVNLSREIEKQLPSDLVGFLKMAGKYASTQKIDMYLVGGVVRDLLLKQPNFDLDIVVESDAIELAQKLAEQKRTEVTIHPRFGTANMKLGDWSIDFTTARSETYAEPGALPTVESGSLPDDLYRRDFTINAMAVRLSGGKYGELIDLYGGKEDLNRKLIRVLHENSFIDDATRIWRALRYEQRLNFYLGPTTLRVLRRDISMLDTISGDRIRHELELVLMEEFPEKVLRRADELGVLARMNPSLRGDIWLADRFEQARNNNPSGKAQEEQYLSILAYRLKDKDIENLISYLRFSNKNAQIIKDTVTIKAGLKPLTEPGLAPSHIYHVLNGYSPAAITSNLLATDSSIVRKNIQLYLDKLRHIKPLLSSSELMGMGIPAGPRIKEIFAELLVAKLDGKVTNKKDEEELVRGLI